MYNACSLNQNPNGIKIPNCNVWITQESKKVSTEHSQASGNQTNKMNEKLKYFTQFVIRKRQKLVQTIIVMFLLCECISQ